MVRNKSFATKYFLFFLFLQGIFILLNLITPIGMTFIQMFSPIIIGFALWIIGFWVAFAYFIFIDFWRNKF